MHAAFRPIAVSLCLFMLPGVSLAGDIDGLIQGLGASTYPARQRAQKDLEKKLIDPGTTPEERGKVRQAAENNPDLEIRTRARRALGVYNLTLPAVKSITDCTMVQVTKVVPDQGPLAGETDFKFGIYRGQVTNGNNELEHLSSKYNKLRNALAAADMDAADTALNDLKNFVRDMPADKYTGLGLKVYSTTLGRWITEEQTEAVDKLCETLNFVAPARNQVVLNDGPDPPGPVLKIPVTGAGPQNFGQTFLVSIEDAVTPGEVDLFTPRGPDAMTRAPSGYQWVGELFDVLPDEFVEIGGPVSVGISFSDPQILGRDVDDPSQLQIARYANGLMEILPSVVDPGNQIVFALYDPTTNGDEGLLNGFGTFGLIQVPAPPATLPFLFGACCFRRRR